jgi:NADP-dependent 3-hydroxy acid dehydrogenase YdfG
MTSSLNGTVAIVTGSSSGIGRATALELARHGASIALVARRKDRLDSLVGEIENAGGTAIAVASDITDRGQAESAVQEVIERFGRLDILINNAGLMLLGPVVGADPRSGKVTADGDMRLLIVCAEDIANSLDRVPPLSTPWPHGASSRTEANKLLNLY